MLNSTSQAIGQSGEFFLEMLWSVFGNHFPFGFDLQSGQSIEKVVLFQSTQGRTR
jgi:hypothetical protein